VPQGIRVPATVRKREVRSGDEGSPFPILTAVDLRDDAVAGRPPLSRAPHGSGRS
jgi:hypothetical protein